MMSQKKWIWFCPILIGILITFWGEVESPMELIAKDYFIPNLIFNSTATYFYLGLVWGLTSIWHSYHLNTLLPQFLLFLFTTCCSCLCILGLSYFYLDFIWGDQLSNYPELFHTDIPVYLLLTLLFQLYLINNFSVKVNTYPVPEKAPEDTNPFIIAKNRNQTMAFKPADIALCYLKNGIVYLVDFHGQRKIVDVSLNQLSKKLPSAIFFQANRQLIIHAKTILGYEELPTRKLVLNLNLAFEGKISVSKAKAAIFKRWWLAQTQNRPMSASSSSSARFNS